MTTDSPINEQWRDVVGYEGLYQVSDHGRVMTLRQATSARYTPRRKSPILKAHPTHRGYLHVVLRRDGESYTHLIHHLVAFAFIGERPHKMVINHKDSNQLNNHVSNLEYITQRENCLHSVEYRNRLQSFASTTESASS